jgi:hypothetical protein
VLAFLVPIGLSSGFFWDADGTMIVASGGIGGTAALPADAAWCI